MTGNARGGERAAASRDERQVGRYLDGELVAGERSRFEREVEARPELARLLDATGAADRQARDALVSGLVTRASRTEFQGARSREALVVRFFTRALVAVAALVVSGVGVWWYAADDDAVPGGPPIVVAPPAEVDGVVEVQPHESVFSPEALSRRAPAWDEAADFLPAAFATPGSTRGSQVDHRRWYTVFDPEEEVFHVLEIGRRRMVIEVDAIDL